MSHLGRPKGKIDSKFSLEAVATYLADKLDIDVVMSDKPVDAGVKELLTLNETKIVLLENLRFDAGEEDNDEIFAHKLAAYADIYVNDAFGAAHREHASVHKIQKFFQNRNYAGFLMKAELEALNKILETPKKPFISIVGGAKVSDKIKTLERLIPNVDSLIIGGAMAYPFLKANGIEVGSSLCSDEDVALAKSLLRQDKGNKIVLPLDHVVSQSFDGDPEECHEQSIPSDRMGLDIGPKSCEKFSSLIAKANTILWNGPMGIFENPHYAKGTNALCEAIANSNAYSLVGGGDSVSAVQKSGLADKFSHVSTGGGASLEYIEKGDLPGIRALKFGVN
jgi:phosphoglycerate kinase